MTIDEAIRHCEEVAEYMEQFFGSANSAVFTRQITEWLKQVPRWISVKDRLPNDKQRVLIYSQKIDEFEVCTFYKQSQTFTLFGMWDIPIETVDYWIPFSQLPKLNSKYTRTDASESLDNLGEDDNESEEEEYE